MFDGVLDDYNSFKLKCLIPINFYKFPLEAHLNLKLTKVREQSNLIFIDA